MNELTTEILGLIRDSPNDRNTARLAKEAAKLVGDLGPPIDAAFVEGLQGPKLKPLKAPVLLVIADGGLVWSWGPMVIVALGDSWQELAPMQLTGDVLRVGGGYKFGGFQGKHIRSLAAVIAQRATVVGHDGGERRLSIRVRCVGGYGHPLVDGDQYRLTFSPAEWAIERGSEQVVGGKVSDLLELDISGPGAYTTGGGWEGGGFGLIGAARGKASADLLNALTTKHHIETVLRLRWPDAAAFFVNEDRTPEDLRVVLASTLDGIADRARSAAPAPTDISASLARLADMFEKGLLTEDEYKAAKAQALGGST